MDVETEERKVEWHVMKSVSRVLAFTQTKAKSIHFKLISLLELPGYHENLIVLPCLKVSTGGETVLHMPIVDGTST